MARNLTEILTDIDKEAATHKELAPLQTNDSKVAFWSYCKKTVALAIQTMEVMFDKHKREVQNTIDTTEIGTRDWYILKALQYQHGNKLFLFDNVLTYEKIDPSRQIVKKAGIVETRDSLTVVLKVLKQDNEVLTLEERAGLAVYMGLIKIFGTKMEVRSEVADRLVLRAEFLLDPQLFDARGVSHIDRGKSIRGAITSYLHNIPIDGVFRVIHLVDAIQAMAGVVDVNIISTQVELGGRMIAIGRTYESYSGHFVLDAGSSLKYSLVGGEGDVVEYLEAKKVAEAATKAGAKPTEAKPAEAKPAEAKPEPKPVERGSVVEAVKPKPKPAEPVQPAPQPVQPAPKPIETDQGYWTERVEEPKPVAPAPPPKPVEREDEREPERVAEPERVVEPERVIPPPPPPPEEPPPLFYIPDDEFRAYIKSVIPNAMQGDQMITTHDDVVWLDKIKLPSSPPPPKNFLPFPVSPLSPPRSLEGIEYFINLTELICELIFPEQTDIIYTLDVSKNRKLRVLDCSGTNLHSLNVTNNPELRVLKCDGTKLTAIDLSNNPELLELDIPAKISRLNLSNNKKLTRLDCSRNEALPSLDLSNNPELADLDCRYVKFASLDLSQNRKLTDLNCNKSGLTALDVSNNPELADLDFGDTKIAQIDLSRNRKLQNVSCDSTPITRLDVSNCPELEKIKCFKTKINRLDLSRNPLLKTLWCEKTLLTDLDFTFNSKLNYLDCNDSPITRIVFADMPHSMSHLKCEDTQITRLDLTNAPELTTLNCSRTKITSLVLSNNKKLVTFSCSYNPLTLLDIRGIRKFTWEWNLSRFDNLENSLRQLKIHEAIANEKAVKALIERCKGKGTQFETYTGGVGTQPYVLKTIVYL